MKFRLDRGGTGYSENICVIYYFIISFLLARKSGVIPMASRKTDAGCRKADVSY